MRIAFITPEFVTNEYFSCGLANDVHRVSITLMMLCILTGLATLRAWLSWIERVPLTCPY